MSKSFSVGLDLGAGDPKSNMRNTILNPPRDASPFGKAGAKTYSTTCDSTPKNFKIRKFSKFDTADKIQESYDLE
jgi:hypothetical protein